MKKVKLAVLIILAIVLGVLVLQNTAPVQMRFLWITGEMSAVLLLFLTAVGGFVLGLVLTAFMKNGEEGISKDKS